MLRAMILEIVFSMHLTQRCFRSVAFLTTVTPTMSVDFVEEWAAVGVTTWKSLLDLYDEIGCTDSERADEAQKLFESIKEFCQEQVFSHPIVDLSKILTVPV